MGRTVAQLKATLGNIQRFPGLLRFLVARFWYIWSVNTSASFAILYGTGTVGFEERHVEVVLLVGVFVAIPSGLLWGIVVDRVGPNRALSVVLVGWVFMLVMAALIPWLDLPSYLWWGIAVSAGVLVAGVWVADRPYMLRLTSPPIHGGVLRTSRDDGQVVIHGRPVYVGLYRGNSGAWGRGPPC